MNSLTPKQARFCEEYMIDLNGKQAAIRAGYSAKTAENKASNLLRLVKVGSRIDKLKKARSKRTEIEVDQVVKELALVAFANMLDYISIEDGVARIDLSELSPDQAAAIHEIKTEHMESGQCTKIKLIDKLRALTKLGEHLGIFSQTQKHDGVINVAIQNEEAGL